MAIKVFLSHKNEDSDLAKEIGRYLESKNLLVYLDTIDPYLTKSGPELAEYIISQLIKCTHLMAIISPATQTSWWVPWEIGVATEKERYLSSYIYGEVDVPEYLGKWPYLRNRNDLDIYINECRKTDRLFESRIRGGAGVRPYTSDFRAFHESLKSSLGQR